MESQNHFFPRYLKFISILGGMNNKINSYKKLGTHSIIKSNCHQGHSHVLMAFIKEYNEQ